MSSPFVAFANATITFKVPTGIVSVNSVGNRVIETSLIVVKAMLKPVRDMAELNYYIGDDDSAELMSGYLTEPTSLPASLKPPTEGAIVITTALGRSESGTFKLMPRSQSPILAGVGIDYLNKVVGILRRR